MLYKGLPCYSNSTFPTSKLLHHLYCLYQQRTSLPLVQKHCEKHGTGSETHFFWQGSEGGFI